MKRLPGYMAIDMAFAKQTVALEFDGPTHFLSHANGTLSHTPTASTRFKHRTLTMLGWKVLSIDFREAAKHKYSNEWLESLLEKAGVRR